LDENEQKQMGEEQLSEYILLGDWPKTSFPFPPY